METKYMEKNIYKWIRKPFVLLLTALFVLSFSYCSDDEDDNSDGYVQLGIRVAKEDILVDADYVWENAKVETYQAFFMYSNLRHWKLTTANPDDEEWIELWPKEGDKDGRFHAKVKENLTIFKREATINIEAGGKIFYKIPVTQEATTPIFNIDFTDPEKVVAAAGENFEIIVSANMPWKASVSQGAEGWILLPQATEENKQSIEIKENATGAERSGTIIFSGTGTGITKEVPIRQLGS